MTDTTTHPPPGQPSGVVRAITAVIAALPAIGKGDKSPQGYTYRGIEAITKHLQPLLATHGVVIVPQATITSVLPAPGMKESWQDTYMSVQWMVYGPDGSSITANTTGVGRDNSDKGANKAQTQAYKYLLLHLLCIADAKDDTDQASYDHGRSEARRSAPRQQQSSEPTTPAPPEPPPASPERGDHTEAQMKKMQALFAECGIAGNEDKRQFCGEVVGRVLRSATELTKAQMGAVIEALEARRAA